MTASHSAGNIAESLGEMCNEWETPDDCQKYIATDNGSNISAEVRRLPWAERSCIAHNLQQLAVNDLAISCTQASTDCFRMKARQIVGHEANDDS